MKTRRPFILAIASLLALAATTFVADANITVGWWTFRDLDKVADLIVVAKPLSTKDTAEQVDQPGFLGPGTHLVGLSSEFEVGFVLKGDNRLKKLVLHHYRLAGPIQSRINETEIVAFDPKASTRYLLFLKREPDGRYVPIDQTAPENAILALNGTEWDKMKFEDFKDWLDAMKWLDKRVQPQAMSPEIPPAGRGEGSLLEAALNGKLEKAKMLLKTNPELVISLEASQNPLHLAVEYGHQDVAELLLANNADVNARNSQGNTPLHLAAVRGDKDMVQLLLGAKADVNAKNRNGQTALDLATIYGKIHAVELLKLKMEQEKNAL